jgi:hypothetical protein
MSLVLSDIPWWLSSGGTCGSGSVGVVGFEVSEIGCSLFLEKMSLGSELFAEDSV